VLYTANSAVVFQKKRSNRFKTTLQIFILFSKTSCRYSSISYSCETVKHCNSEKKHTTKRPEIVTCQDKTIQYSKYIATYIIAEITMRVTSQKIHFILYSNMK